MSAEETFHQYLQRIDDEMLETVARDFIWLAWEFRNHPPAAGHAARREACREECVRRGRPQLFRNAERILTAGFGEAA